MLLERGIERSGIILAKVLITLTNIVFGVALWKWKKWGVYGIVAVLLVNGGFFIAVSDFGRAFFIIAFFPGLLIVFTRDAWKQDERLLDKTESERIHGWFISLVILVIFLDSVYSGISNIYLGYFVHGDLGQILLGFLNIAGTIFAFAIWKWKKWGVYGIVAIMLIFAGVMLTGERYIEATLEGIVLPGILIIALRNKWDQFN